MIRSTRLALVHRHGDVALAAPAVAGAPGGSSTTADPRRLGSSGSSGSSGSPVFRDPRAASPRRGPAPIQHRSTSSPSSPSATDAERSRRRGTYSRVPTSAASRSSASARRASRRRGGVVAGSGIVQRRFVRRAAGRAERVDGVASATRHPRIGAQPRRTARSPATAVGARPVDDNVLRLVPVLRTVGLLLPVVRLGVRLDGSGYVGYDPWLYGATSWGWGRYGMWYDPLGYYPYYDPYFYGGGGGGGGDELRASRKSARPVGSIRLKANVKAARRSTSTARSTATVDEFDGLGDHLELDGGRAHARAAGRRLRDLHAGNHRRARQDGTHRTR